MAHQTHEALVAQTCVVAAVDLLLSEFDEETSEKARRDDKTFVFTAACSVLCRDDRVKIEDYVEKTVQGYLPDQFKRMFRVSIDTFELILQHLSQLPVFQQMKPPCGRQKVPLDKKLLMVLWYLATQDTIVQVSDRFGVQLSTCLYNNRQMADVFNAHLFKKFVVWPGVGDKDDIIAAFEALKGFPGVLGAIDGTHIAIKALGDNEAAYVNRKSYHSIILQGICRRDRLFTDVYCGWPGRVNDARVYRNSPFFANKESLCGRNHIIGDSAYPLSSYLMKSYQDTGHLTRAEKHFNKSLSSTRSVIENAFGILKGRFRRLKFINMDNIEYIVKTVTMCCILHNICIMNNDELDEVFHHEDPAVVAYCDPHLPAQDALGVLKRQLITRQIAGN